MKETITFTISDVSKQFNLPASTLRYYEMTGLLSHVERNGKHRVYSQAHINRLDAIQCFKQTGMSIKQIEAFFYHEDVTQNYETLIDLLTEQSNHIEAQIQLFKENQQHIEKKLNFYQKKKISFELGQTPPSWDELD